MKRFAAPILVATAVIAIIAAATTATETDASARTAKRPRDCPSAGEVFGGGTAMGAAVAGWRHIIAADPVIEVQGRRYRRSRLNTPLVEVVDLGAVDTVMGPLPGVRALRQLAKKRCPKVAPAVRDLAWALVYHESASVICCDHWFLFAWRSRDKWHVY